MRTTCWPNVEVTNKTVQSVVLSHVFIQDCRINKIYKICLQLFHKDGTEIVNDVCRSAASPQVIGGNIMPKAKQSRDRGDSKFTTDHDEIRNWVEERGGQPSRVEGTNLLRIDYPGFSGEGTLEPMEWDEFFRIFDKNKLAFLYQEETKDGGESRFSKFVDRDSVDDE